MPQEYSSNIERLQNEFKEKVCHYLSSDHAKGTALLRFLRGRIFRWYIEDVDAFDVLLEGIKRGLRTIQETGQPIEKPEAWLRGACLNILRDKVKQSVKKKQLVQNLSVWYSSHNSCSENPLAEAELIEQLEVLQKAFQQLSSSDQEIIRLRFYSEKTYKNIQKIYELRDGQFIEEATLRKREARALGRLQKLFFTLYQPSNNPAI